MVDDVLNIIYNKGKVEYNAMTPRLSYVTGIYREMKKSACSLTTPAQEKAYQEALAHVVNALSKRTQIQAGTVLSAGLRACCNNETKSRKECLKGVFDLLTYMERKRFYDPPSNDEFQYYLLIKKYAKSMAIFFDAWSIASNLARRPMWIDTRIQYECFTSCYPLEHAEELKSLVEHFANLAKCVLDLDITNFNLIKPSMSMGTKDSKGTLHSMDCGSRERSSVFYWHKFFLAALDLRTSELAFGPPEEDERLSYLRALDVLDRHGNQLEDKMDIYSEELHFLFFERVHDGYSNLERHFKTIARALLEKLHINACLESLLKDAKVDYNSLAKKLAEGCEIPVFDLPGYITDIDRCIVIAQMIYFLFQGRSYRNNNVIDYMNGVTNPAKRKEVAWGALHAVTLSNYGCGSNLDEHGNLLVLRDPPEEGDLLKDRRKVQYLDPGEGKNKNLEILRVIVEDLRHFGESVIGPDKEERTLMNKIWQKAAWAAHFFTCVTAFEHKRRVVQHGGSLNVSSLSSRPENKEDTRVTGEDVHEKLRIIRKDISCFLTFLYAYIRDIRSLRCS